MIDWAIRLDPSGEATVREIGIIAREEDAKLLADFLLTKEITTRLERRPLGWALWVHREDRVPEAREFLAEFEADPNDSRFGSAPKTAKEIRKQAEKLEREHRKLTKSLRDRWEGGMFQRAPLAFTLIVLCVAAFLLEMFVGDQVYGSLMFSFIYQDQDGVLHDTGFDLIRNGQIWRLITPIFIHSGPMHLFFNMVGMRFLGEQIEMRKGSWKLALIVLISAIGGNVGQFYHTGGAFGGISGVVFALAGYLWIKGHTDPADGLALSERNANWMIAWLLLGIIAPLTVPDSAQHGFPFNMANVAHGVGLITGVIFGLLRF